MRKYYCLYFKWKEVSKVEVAYEEKDNDLLSNYVSYVSAPLRILISGDLTFLQQLLANKMSGKWYHWCMLSSAELENCDHEKGDMWSIQSIKDNLKNNALILTRFQVKKKNVYCKI